MLETQRGILFLFQCNSLPPPLDSPKSSPYSNGERHVMPPNYTLEHLTMAMTSGGNAAALRDLAPSGSLRVAIAVGPAASALWCVRDAATGKPRGVPVE